MLCAVSPIYAQTQTDTFVKQADSLKVYTGSDTSTAKSRTKLSLKDESKRHSAKKAMIFSAILPGLGQAYNHQYWKIPIIYGALGGLSYAIYITAHNRKIYGNAYGIMAHDSTTTSVLVNGQYFDINEAQNYLDNYKRLQDLSSIVTALVYVLQIVDATVYGHLFHFDISDKLTLHMMPVYDYQANGTGYFGLRLNLHL